MILSIDFDRVIHDIDHPIDGKRMGPPMPGAVQAMRQMHERGHKLIVHSTRTGKHIADWLAFYGIPWDDITSVKQTADVYLDDKAVRFTSWAEFRPEDYKC